MELLECRLTIDDLDAFVEQIGSVGDRHETTIQAFDAAYVADRQHLERAVELADRAIDRGDPIARDRAIEILCYAAGRRQINRAFEMGVEAGTQAAVILVDGEGDDEAAAIAELRSLDAVVDVEPTLDTPDLATVCAFFAITDAERSATAASIGALVRERVALLDVEK